MLVNRDVRVRKASVLIKRNPTWGYRRINKALREEFGVGLRAEYLSGVKQRRIKAPPRVSKSTREKRAKQMIIDHPSWGKRHINKELRKELGAGLRDDTVARLKEKTLTGRPRAQTGRKSVIGLLAEEIITPERVTTIGLDEAYHRLRSAGFLNMEIRRLLSAGNIPGLFNTDAFRIMLRNRRQWLNRMLRDGWSKERIIIEIKRYYSVEGRDVFDFLKDVYNLPGYKKLRIDRKKYRTVAAKTAGKKVKKLYRTPVKAR